MLTMRLDILIAKPNCNLIDRDDHCACAFSNGDRVAQVIAMSMAEEDKFHLNRIRRNSSRRIAVEERVNNNFVSIGFEPLGGVPIPGEFRSHKNLLLV